MALDINRMDYNVLYKTLDERKMYFTTGITYVAKSFNSEKKLSLKKPIIYVYNFDLEGKVNHVSFGKLMNLDCQNGVEYSILGWTIDKDSNIDEIGLKETAKEITCSWETLDPVSAEENEKLNKEILDFFENHKGNSMKEVPKRKRMIPNIRSN